MPAKITYFGLEDLASKDNKCHAWVEGTLAEILASTPTAPALGKPTDSTTTVNFTPEGGWTSPLKNNGTTLVSDKPIAAPNSISSFLPGQTAGVPDTASLTVAAGVSQRVALPTGTVFRLDWSGFGPFAFRFGSSSVVAVATDFPGAVGLPQYFEKPSGTTYIAVYGIGGGTLIVSGGSRP